MKKRRPRRSAPRGKKTKGTRKDTATMKFTNEQKITMFFVLM